MPKTTVSTRKWYDSIYAYHVLAVFLFLVSFIILGFVMYHVVPGWKFLPKTTHCTILDVSTVSGYTEDGYSSYKMFRTVVRVKYNVAGKGVVESSVYGPENQDGHVDKAGYTLDKFSATEWASTLTTGASHICYYSRKDHTRVTFSGSPLFNLLFLLPTLVLITSISVCVFPKVSYLVRKKKAESLRRKQYLELNEMEQKYEDDQNIELDADYSIDLGGAVSTLLNKLNQPPSSTSDPEARNADLDDEFILEEEVVETVGSFFGVNIDHDGHQTFNPLVTEDDIQYETDEEEETKQNLVITNAFIILDDEGDDEYSSSRSYDESDDASYESDY